VGGKHSGRHALKSKCVQLGFPVEGPELDSLFTRFKAIAEQKTGGVDDGRAPPNYFIHSLWLYSGITQVVLSAVRKLQPVSN
jgi:hypothetical protein